MFPELLSDRGADDYSCCHMPVLNGYGDVEYRMEAAIKGMIREVDPWRLMFGSIACGETWYWTEEGAGLAMDVMMKVSD